MKCLLSYRLGIAWLLVSSFGLAGCSRPPASAPPPPTSVSVSYPIERAITDSTDFTGRTAAVDSVEVRAHVWGYLDKINFREGALVNKDDVLFEIDPRPYQALLAQAKADLESKQALAVKTEALYKRSLALVQSNAASKEDVDNTRGDWMVAKANILLSKANIETAELNLGFTQVKAQITGRASKHNVTVGNIIQSGDQSGGTVLTTIVSIDPMYANFDVDERTVLRVRGLIREGKAKSVRDLKHQLPVFLGLANEVGFPHEGEISFADNQVNPSTGTMRLRGLFPNKQEVLTPGLFVRVRVPIGEAHRAVLVSERAIDSDQGQKIVYIVDAKHEVVLRPIQLGALHDGLRVVEAGLDPKEQVIVNGLQ